MAQVDVNPERSVRYQSSGTIAKKKVMEVIAFQVNEVYIYIPAELSAAGFELKIAGSVRISEKNGQFCLSWLPSDLTQQDVASLYSSAMDDWTVVDKLDVEPPVMIDIQELEHASKDYPGGNLELPDPILPDPAHQGSKVNAGEDESSATGVVVLGAGEAVTFNKGGHGGDSGLPGRLETVDFPLCDLHCVKEGGKGKRSLTFFLKGSQELPTLHFHDGGTSGLLQTMQRYIYLERDSRHRGFYYAKEFDKTKRPKPSSKLGAMEEEDSEPPQFKTITPQGSKASDVQYLIQGVMGNLSGLTRVVRHHLMPDKLLEVRPGTENDEEEETIQTCVLSDVKTDPSSPIPSPSPSPSPKTNTSRPTVPPRPSSAEVKKSRPQPGITVDPDASLITDYQLITDIRGKLPPRPALSPRQPPLSSDEWERLRDDWGRITPSMEQHFRARVFAGGIDHTLRKEVWKYLLRYYPFEVTDIERMELREEKEKAYWIMKQQWKAFTPDQESRFHKWREVKHLINKDVLRTDREFPLYRSLNNPKIQQLEDILRTYVMYNFDLGYVQGMSDLLAPLLVVMDNEVDAFWCFVGFMSMVEHHFEMSQEGMRNRLKQLRALLNITDPKFYQFLKDKECNNLYFCFRWLIVHFKREFSYDSIMSLWEVIWTGYLSSDFPLFVALAILSKEREALLNTDNDFSDILQHVNELAKKMPLPPILELAESLCYQLGSSPALPDDLQTLLVKPLPPRATLTSLPQLLNDTVICKPDSRAVPSHS